MILTEEQNGFRTKRSTYEHIFTLTSLIETRISVGKGTFAAFDFQKAYDSIMSPFTLGKVEAVWHIWCTIADFTNNITI